MTPTWLDLPPDTAFPVENLPYGVFSIGEEEPRVGVAIGDWVLDLAPLAAEESLGAEVFEEPSLNPFMALGRPAWQAVRRWLTDLLVHDAYRDLVEAHMLPRRDVRLHLPFAVADYVDFFASEHHAAAMGRLLRPGTPPLPAAWRHLPIGYHGRAGTVVLSGTEVVRPCGLRRVPGADEPSFGPSLRLDVEAEVGFVVGVPSALGVPVPVTDFAEHVFGVVLVNDWSARDLQAFEYVPLGPFLGKSFATSISPWVVPLDALEAARLAPPPRDPEPADYLHDAEPWGLDLALEVAWNATVVSRPPYSSMHWTPAQMLAHLTANGASLRTGDLYASGTVSGPSRDQSGSFMELTLGGAEPVTLGVGETRGFLEDGDEVRISGSAPGPEGVRIGLGEVVGQVVPAGGR